MNRNTQSTHREKWTDWTFPTHSPGWSFVAPFQSVFSYSRVEKKKQEQSISSTFCWSLLWTSRAGKMSNCFLSSSSHTHNSSPFFPIFTRSFWQVGTFTHSVSSPTQIPYCILLVVLPFSTTGHRQQVKELRAWRPMPMDALRIESAIAHDKIHLPDGEKHLFWEKRFFRSFASLVLFIFTLQVALSKSVPMSFTGGQGDCVDHSWVLNRSEDWSSHRPFLPPSQTRERICLCLLAQYSILFPLLLSLSLSLFFSFSLALSSSVSFCRTSEWSLLYWNHLHITDAKLTHIILVNRKERKEGRKELVMVMMLLHIYSISPRIRRASVPSLTWCRSRGDQWMPFPLSPILPPS